MGNLAPALRMSPIAQHDEAYNKVDGAFFEGDVHSLWEILWFRLDEATLLRERFGWVLD
jgi:hypothetical protein